MGQEAIKLELIEWLTKLNDISILNYLKTVKDSKSDNQDWWSILSEIQKSGIKRGLKDIDNGNVVSHSEVKKKYGL